MPAPLCARPTEELYPGSIEGLEPASVMPNLPDSLPLDAPLRANFCFQASPFPAFWVARLPDCRVFSHNGVVIDKENVLLSDLTHEFGNYARRFRICHYAGLPPSRKIAGRLLVLPSISCWKNFSHWLLEALPRLRGVTAADFDWVLAPTRANFHLDAMEELGIPREKVIPAQSDTHLQAEELIVPRPFPPGIISPPAVTFLRQQLLSPPKRTGRMLYLSRNDAYKRLAINESQVIETLRAKGFEVAQLTGMKLREQAQLFASADFIVSIHGAALANLVFCRPGTRVVEIFSREFLRDQYARLATLLELQYSGISFPNDSNSWHFQIDIDRLLAAIKTAPRAPNTPDSNDSCQK